MENWIKYREICNKNRQIKSTTNSFFLNGVGGQRTWKKNWLTKDCGFQKGLQLKYKEKIGYVLLLKKGLVLQISETVDKQNCLYAH